VKLGIPTCLSCYVISFCLFVHLPKTFVHEVQHLLLCSCYNLFPIGNDESGLQGGKLVVTSQVCV